MVDLIPTPPPAPQPYRPAPPAPAKPPEKAKPPPLSLSMTPDEYGARLGEEREKAFAAEEKRLQEKHKDEDERLKKLHAAELDSLKARRESSKAEVDAVKKHVEMWQRQAEESRHGDRDVLLKKHDAERVALARKTGYEVRKPTMGDTTVAGFTPPLVAGHPWVRTVDVPLSTHLHPEI